MVGKVRAVGRALRHCALALGLVMCVGCGGDSENSPAGGQAVACGSTPTTAYQGRNNGGIIDGPELGTGSAAPDALRRAVQMQPDAPHPAFEVGPAFVTRDDPNTEVAFFIVAVKNIGSVADCFIQFEEVKWRSASGLLGELDFFFVTGSLGLLDTGLYTTTCLAPGESGFATGIRGGSGGPNFYSDVTSISYTLTTIGEAPQNPQPRLVPRSYDINSRGSLHVTLENTGSCSAVVGSTFFSTYVLLDDGATALMWGFLDLGAGEIGVGARAPAVQKYPLRFGGSARRVQVFFDFEEKLAATSFQSERAAIGETARAASPFARRREQQERALRAWHGVANAR